MSVEQIPMPSIPACPVRAHELATKGYEAPPVGYCRMGQDYDCRCRYCSVGTHNREIAEAKALTEATAEHRASVARVTSSYAALAAIGRAVRQALRPGLALESLLAWAARAYQSHEGNLKGLRFRVVGKRGRAKEHVGKTGICVWVGEVEGNVRYPDATTTSTTPHRPQDRGRGEADLRAVQAVRADAARGGRERGARGAPGGARGDRRGETSVDGCRPQEDSSAERGGVEGELPHGVRGDGTRRGELRSRVLAGRGQEDRRDDAPRSRDRSQRDHLDDGVGLRQRADLAAVHRAGGEGAPGAHRRRLRDGRPSRAGARDPGVHAPEHGAVSTRRRREHLRKM